MDELVKLVAQKANISEENAKTAVETVINALKSKFPALGGQIDSLLSGAAGGDALKGAGDMLGGLLGKKD